MLEQKIYSLQDAAIKSDYTQKEIRRFVHLELIPSIGKDEKNPRFDEYDLQWIRTIRHLQHCHMNDDEIRRYAILYAAGGSTIPERKKMLDAKRQELEAEIYDLQSGLDFISYRQEYYDRIRRCDIDGAARILLESDMCMF